jgi:hypothetical protein
MAECTKITLVYIHKVDFTTSQTFFHLVENTKISAIEQRLENLAGNKRCRIFGFLISDGEKSFITLSSDCV